MIAVTIGNAVLYNANSLELIQTLPMVDAVITDPPYSEQTHQGARSGKLGKDKAINFDSFSEDQFITATQQLVQIANRWVVMFTDWKFAGKADAAGLPVIRCGCWVKTNPMPQMTGDRPGTGWEAILILHRDGKKHWNGKGKPAVYQHGTSRYGYFGPSNHPTEKPVGLVSQLIHDFTDEGELVFDPFMGAGSTGLAALQMKRRFIGCEINPVYFETACRRIEQAQRQSQLF